MDYSPNQMFQAQNTLSSIEFNTKVYALNNVINMMKRLSYYSV